MKEVALLEIIFVSSQNIRRSGLECAALLLDYLGDSRFGVLLPFLKEIRSF